MNLVNRQSLRQNVLLTVSRGVDYKNNIDLLKKAWYRAGPNSSDLESTNNIIFKTKWKLRVKHLLDFLKARFHFSAFFRLFLYTRSVGNLTSSTGWIWNSYMIVFFTPSFRFSKGVSHACPECRIM